MNTATATLTTLDAIARIRTALRARSGKDWSVKRGSGTACGWITISAPPRRCTAAWDGTGEGRNPTLADRVELATLLGFGSEPVHPQGVSVAASTKHYIEYVDRAEGREPSTHGEMYWD